MSLTTHEPAPPCDRSNCDLCPGDVGGQQPLGALHVDALGPAPEYLLDMFLVSAVEEEEADSQARPGLEQVTDLCKLFESRNRKYSGFCTILLIFFCQDCYICSSIGLSQGLTLQLGVADRVDWSKFWSLIYPCCGSEQEPFLHICKVGDNVV